MPTHSDGTHHQTQTSGDVSRRRFIRSAGATAAGAAVLGDPLLQTAFGAEEKKPVGKKVHTRVRRPTSVAAVDANTVVTSDDNGNLIRWKVNGTEAVPDGVSKANHGGKKAAFVTYSDNIMPRARRALTAGYDGRVVLHDVDQLDAGNAFEQHLDGAPKREAWVVAVSPDGTRAVSAANDGQILLWNPSKPGERGEEVAHSREAVGGLAWVPKPGGGATTEFLSTHAEGVVKLWDISKLRVAPREYKHRNQPVNAVAVEKDGNFFVSASFDLTLRMWDPRNMRNPQKTLKGHRNWVWRVAISGDGRLAASAGEDGFVHIWDLTGPDAVIRPAKSFGRHPEGVMGVAFLPPQAGTRPTHVVFSARASSEPQPLIVQPL